MNYLVKSENAIYYECGYSCDNALYIKLGSEAYFITDSRYTLEAQQYVLNATVVIDGALYERAVKILKQSNIKDIIFDPKEFSVAAFNILQSSEVKFIAQVDFSHKKRIIKSNEELKILKQAASFGKKAFKDLAKEISNNGAGQDEYSLTYMAKSILSNYGQYDLSFDPIVAINQNAAAPHAVATSTRLKSEDLLLVDAGLKYKRYCSDRTRTVSFKEDFKFKVKQKFTKKKTQKAYDLVQKAHDNAISKARSGMKAKKIDALTRDIIDKAGFGKYYIHSTGHGVGLDIHEMPYISKKSEEIIEDGMVFTIEPGIYIPGEFGIRIEDMVAMTNGKAVILD